MDISKELLFNGCLISSIAHSISTNEFPEFAYEQSWDKRNFSINDSCGCRGTITFYDDFCVGAIRNERANQFYFGKEIYKIMKHFPKAVYDVLCNETLRYLLVNTELGDIPCITSIFWCDEVLHHGTQNKKRLYQDLELLNNMVLPDQECFSAVAELCCLQDQSMSLVKELHDVKRADFFGRIVLSEQQIRGIPGGNIKPECVESLSELNIFL